MAIKLLDKLVSNQLAAGEVVQRPASVVKELLENSLDANATSIYVEIIDGGTKLILVRDNGCGISKEDLVLAPLRHATSKLSKITELHTLDTMGFRGEALASISSVSNFKLTSKVAGADSAYCIEFNGYADKVSVLPAAHSDGTTIEVGELFYNTPVRRKFLKAIKTEYSHIEELVKSIALSNFHCAFTFIHNSKLIFKLPIANSFAEKQQRIKKLFGESFLKSLNFFEHAAVGISIFGWVASPDFIRRSSDLQFAFVNRRLVKDKVVNHAIRTAYLDKLPKGNFPAYILYLDIDPQEIDINVHPAKYELRFENPRDVHQFILSSIEDNLLSSKVISADFTSSLEQENLNINKNSNFLDEFRSSELMLKERPKIKRKDISFNNTDDYKKTASFYSKTDINKLDLPVNMIKEVKSDITTSDKKLKCIHILHDNYLLLTDDNNSFLLDYIKTSKKFIYIDYLSEVESEEVVAQRLLFPYNLELKNKNFMLLEENLNLFQQLGFNLKIIAPGKCAIITLPVYFTLDNIQDLMDCAVSFISAKASEKISKNQRDFINSLAEKIVKFISIDSFNSKEESVKLLFLKRVFESSSELLKDKCMLTLNESFLKEIL